METHLTHNDLTAMGKGLRGNLINSAGGFKSVCLICTIDKVGQTSLAIFSSIVHIAAPPPLIAFVVMPGCC